MIDSLSDAYNLKVKNHCKNKSYHKKETFSISLSITYYHQSSYELLAIYSEAYLIIYKYWVVKILLWIVKIKNRTKYGWKEEYCYMCT